MVAAGSSELVPPGSPLTTTQTITSALEIAPPAPVLTTTQPAAEGIPTTPTPAASESVTDTGAVAGPKINDRIFATVLTGAHLKDAVVQRNEQTGQFLISFELNEEGGKIFEEFTGRNINKFLSIVLDKAVISSPVIKDKIPGGSGVIEGSFTLEEARNLVVQLRYGALPVPLRVETSRTIGPTLGQDSVQRSIQAGAVGLAIVLLFMLIYYRLPGLLADLALVFYGLLNLAVYKVGWPVLLLISVP
jgi:protein-export membrane protein SecD